jgi:type VI secretion system secreted protein VgrG
MADYDFQIQSESPAVAELMFWRIAGHESLARPSLYELTVLSRNNRIDAKDILGFAFDVVIGFDDAGGGAHQRHCQGHAVRFVRAAAVGRYFEYHITLRSWFWLLTKRRNSRILQDKPVLEVLDAVFADSPISRFKKTDAAQVIGTHLPRRYCVQHQETDFQFLSRLLEDEGIYYWFDAHDAPGTMHLADASDVAHARLPAGGTLKFASATSGEARANEITRWTSARVFGSGKFASRDSDFKAIRKLLPADKADPDKHELADLEVFEFPGGVFRNDDADAKAKLRTEEQVGQRDRHWALTAWPDVAAGRSFHFEGDPDGMRDGDYNIATCTFVVIRGGYESLGVTENARPLAETLRQMLDDDAVLHDTRELFEALLHSAPQLQPGQRGTSAFLLTAMPLDMPWRPPRLTPRVTMPGPQSAIVVGAAGKEIDADEFGRVKVHFHWDRYDSSDEKSTCWVRVTQPWAGKGWGGYFTPRIGQEVLVDFLNGDPDRPIIVGRMYNDDQPIPYTSPTQSGFKTRSTPGGNTSTFNELRFEDQIGQEQIHLHAEKDLDVLVEKQETRKVGTNSYTKVKDDLQLSVGAKRTADVGGNDILKVVGNRSTSVGGNQGTTVNGSTKFTSMGDWHSAAPNIEVNGTVSYKLSSIAITSIATAAYKVDAATYTLSAPSISVSGTTIEQKASAAQRVTAGASLSMGAADVTITAKGSLTLQCGASTIVLSPAGIKIGAPTIDVNGAGMVSIIGAVVKTNA